MILFFICALLSSSVSAEESDEIFVGLHLGFASNLTNHISGSYGSFGVSTGSYIIDKSGLMLEVAIFYSLHEVSDDGFDMYYSNVYNRRLSPFSDVRQATGAISLKYTPLLKKFRPYIGLSALYNLWVYDNDSTGDPYFFCPYDVSVYSTNYCNSGKKTTNSIDLGAYIGLDVKINKKISLGFNLLINVVNLYNNNNNVFKRYRLYHDDVFYGFHSPNTNTVNMEETNWVIASINAKMYF